ncbi:hypothetical protein CVT25_002880 [Psilocybe cyanescens]|uniref:Uncharacterized protein n=1 Tax=Psilocybe cyanescens TaxID=93625 RepID=A0A409WKV6_PSICY|nr:hypothetical protein CVT25_002880 [Psilocybe cyanescens]
MQSPDAQVMVRPPVTDLQRLVYYHIKANSPVLHPDISVGDRPEEGMKDLETPDLPINNTNPTIEEMNATIDRVNKLEDSELIKALIRFTHMYYSEIIQSGQTQIIDTAKNLVLALWERRSQWKDIVIIVPGEVYDHLSERILQVKDEQGFAPGIETVCIAETFEANGNFRPVGPPKEGDVHQKFRDPGLELDYDTIRLGVMQQIMKCSPNTVLCTDRRPFVVPGLLGSEHWNALTTLRLLEPVPLSNVHTVLQYGVSLKTLVAVILARTSEGAFHRDIAAGTKIRNESIQSLMILFQRNNDGPQNLFNSIECPTLKSLDIRAILNYDHEAYKDLREESVFCPVSFKESLAGVDCLNHLDHIYLRNYSPKVEELKFNLGELLAESCTVDVKCGGAFLPDQELKDFQYF